MNPYGTANLAQAVKDMEKAKAAAEATVQVPEFDPKHVVGLHCERINIINPTSIAGLGVTSSISRGAPLGASVAVGTIWVELVTTPAGVLVTNLRKGLRSIVPWGNIASAELMAET